MLQKITFIVSILIFLHPSAQVNLNYRQCWVYIPGISQGPMIINCTNGDNICVRISGGDNLNNPSFVAKGCSQGWCNGKNMSIDYTLQSADGLSTMSCCDTDLCNSVS
ncbi:unnamed protein product, partial [Mesorhabditis belari]|uniref:UPAR/Ly6 domain-containing protein n=1 Tax=Mesorhabditis belari TaxID=2138241 RepID=A0AAF3J2F9_9BILA